MIPLSFCELAFKHPCTGQHPDASHWSPIAERCFTDSPLWSPWGFSRAWFPDSHACLAVDNMVAQGITVGSGPHLLCAGGPPVLSANLPLEGPSICHAGPPPCYCKVEGPLHTGPLITLPVNSYWDHMRHAGLGQPQHTLRCVWVRIPPCSSGGWSSLSISQSLSLSLSLSPSLSLVYGAVIILASPQTGWCHWEGMHWRTSDVCCLDAKNQVGRKVVRWKSKKVLKGIEGIEKISVHCQSWKVR